MRSARLAIVGAVGSGKTGALRELMVMAKEAGLEVGGVLQPAVDAGRPACAYLLEDAATGERRPFVRRAAPGLPLTFDPAGWDWAAARIRSARAAAGAVVVDELGVLEARGGGHLPALLDPPVDDRARVWLLAVRGSVAAAIEARIGAFDATVTAPFGRRALAAALDALRQRTG